MAGTGRAYGGLWGPLVLFATGMTLGVVLWRYLVIEGTGDGGEQGAQARAHAGWSRASR